MIDSVLKQTAMQSPLGGVSVLGPKGGQLTRNLAADLLLTALIDAFSILVIFLLMSFSSSGEILFINKNMELPKAGQAEMLERNPVVKLDGEQVFLENKPVASGDALFQALLEMKRKLNETSPDGEAPAIITVQADRHVKYQALNQIVVACAQAGFSDIRFAVLMK